MVDDTTLQFIIFPLVTRKQKKLEKQQKTKRNKGQGYVRVHIRPYYRRLVGNKKWWLNLRILSIVLMRNMSEFLSVNQSPSASSATPSPPRHPERGRKSPPRTRQPPPPQLLPRQGHPRPRSGPGDLLSVGRPKSQPGGRTSFMFSGGGGWSRIQAFASFQPDPLSLSSKLFSGLFIIHI